jgi:hypothetical protein
VSTGAGPSVSSWTGGSRRSTSNVKPERRGPREGEGGGHEARGVRVWDMGDKVEERFKGRGRRS